MQSVSVPSNYTLGLSGKLHNSGLAMTLPLVGSPYICNNKDRRPYLHQHVFDQFNTVTELALNFELHISIEVLAFKFHIFCFQNIGAKAHRRPTYATFGIVQMTIP